MRCSRRLTATTTALSVAQNGGALSSTSAPQPLPPTPRRSQHSHSLGRHLQGTCSARPPARLPARPPTCRPVSPACQPKQCTETRRSDTRAHMRLRTHRVQQRGKAAAIRPASSEVPAAGVTAMGSGGRSGVAGGADRTLQATLARDAAGVVETGSLYPVNDDSTATHSQRRDRQRLSIYCGPTVD